MQEEKKVNGEETMNKGITRRTFIKGAAAGVAAVGLASILPAAEAEAATKTSLFTNPKELIGRGKALKIQDFPCSKTDEFKELFKKQEAAAKTREEIYYHPYTGLFRETVTWNGQAEGAERILYTYIPDKTSHCASSVFVAIPPKTKPELFLVQSGWVKLADEYKFLLHAFAPVDNKTWGKDEEEQAYMKAAFALGQKTAKYSPYTGNLYMVGYGEGGRLLHQYVMTDPDNCSGLAVIDGSNISADYLESMESVPAIAVDKTVNQINVPVWIVEKAKTKNVKKVIKYWQKANMTDDECFMVTTAFNTVVYNQKTLSPNFQINAYPLGKVQVTIGYVNYLDQNFARNMWENFLCKTMRYNSIQGKDLRPAVDFDALGITKEWRVIDGYHRYWLEYVPRKVKENPDQAVPLVMAFHGAGQCGEAYAPYSEWWKMADEANFIVVFPTAYPYAENNGMARPIHNDCWGTDRPNDLSFWRQMISDIKSRHNIDASRVYTTGHSNGGNTSAMIAGEMGDIVTAAAISAGRYRNADGVITKDVATLHPMASDTNGLKMPVMQMVGTKDGGAYHSTTMTPTMMYWIQKDECVDIDNPQKFKAGVYHNQVWSDKDGIPWVRYVVIENKPHTTMPSEARMFYYDFLVDYYRDENGVIHYRDDQTILDSEDPFLLNK
ncbi:MAG: PHB depolymerase family esterase [Clostridiales bacterium]|nr:PHB depolymerase family esterase [Clostridiales bacterium]